MIFLVVSSSFFSASSCCLTLSITDDQMILLGPYTTLLERIDFLDMLMSVVPRWRLPDVSVLASVVLFHRSLWLM